MKPLRFSVRNLILLVAAAAVSIGGWLEYAKLKNLSNYYRSHAMGFASNVHMRRYDLAKVKGELRRLEASENVNGLQLELLHARVYELQATIAANANLVSIYEHAASHPWEAVPEVATDSDNVEASPIVKRFPPNPHPPDFPRFPDPTRGR